MDTTDPDIVFDSNGICNHCRIYDHAVQNRLFSGKQAELKLRSLVSEIRQAGKNRPYDCVVGVSGGVDSTFTAYHVRKLGLRALAVHLDNGWNSTMAVENIQKVLKNLDMDLYTIVLDWEEFRNLQLSFLKASVPDFEIPTDHAIHGALYHAAASRNIPTIINGYNLRTEAVHPRSWSHGILDWKYIRSIHERFGSIPLSTFPGLSLWKFIRYKWVQRIRTVHLLNYIPFRRTEAIRVLEQELGWQDYPVKHSESIITRFMQDYILPRKFGFQVERSHLSALICAGEMGREEAMAAIHQKTEPDEPDTETLEFVVKKLGLSLEEFETLMSLPQKNFNDYPSYERNPVTRILLRLLTKRISIKDVRAYWDRRRTRMKSDRKQPVPLDDRSRGSVS